MTLQLTRSLIAAAVECDGPMRVYSREDAREVVLMADAGLVRAATSLHRHHVEATILAVTSLGLKLLRALRGVRFNGDSTLEAYEQHSHRT
jgi:hypothetical protein